jgi:hypothetical protein
LLLGTNIHAARQHDANPAALEAALAGAFQFGGQPMARILSVVTSPAAAFLADEDYRPAHRRFGIPDEPLRFTHGVATCGQPIGLVPMARESLHNTTFRNA